MMDRNTALRKYEEAKEAGKVDGDIIPLLDMINSLSEYYTTSSCSGRIVIMQLPEMGDKVNSEFLGKWHREVELSEIKNAISKHNSGILMLMVQSAIIHVVAEDIAHANILIRIARDSGFKYSSIRVASDNGVLVEILSSEHLSVPLGYNGEIMVNEEYLKFTTSLSNVILNRIKNKLRELENNISSLLLASS